MIKAFDADDNEIEVYTAADVQAAEVAAAEKMRGEYAPKVTALETELTGAKSALAQRAGEFANFRKLSDEAVAKLDEAQRTIYNNGLLLQEERDKNAKSEKDRVEKQVDVAIRAKAGTDEKLYTKMKDMFGIIGIEATTPEAIETKVKMVIGAIGVTEPDLVASVAGFSGGSFQPPVVKKEGEAGFGDTPQGKSFANDLGLKIEPEKKKE